MIEKYRNTLTPTQQISFMHFCGKHEGFLKLICEAEFISTLNLGNPGAYDLDDLFSLFAKTGTVYFGAVDSQEGEDGRSYLERMANYYGRHGTRLILVSDYLPGSGEEKEKLVRRWHQLTERL